MENVRETRKIFIEISITWILSLGATYKEKGVETYEDV